MLKHRGKQSVPIVSKQSVPIVNPTYGRNRPAQTDEGWAHRSLKRQEAREISEHDWRTEKKFVVVLAVSIGTHLSLDRNGIEERRFQAAPRS